MASPNAIDLFRDAFSELCGVPGAAQCTAERPYNQLVPGNGVMAESSAPVILDVLVVALLQRRHAGQAVTAPINVNDEAVEEAMALELPVREEGVETALETRSQPGAGPFLGEAEGKAPAPTEQVEENQVVGVARVLEVVDQTVPLADTWEAGRAIAGAANGEEPSRRMPQS